LAIAAVALSLGASFLFGLALVLTQYGLRHMPPLHGALVSIPTSTVLFWVLSAFVMNWDGLDWTAAAIFLAVGILFPASVTLLTFEANRRMGPSVAGALGGVAPFFAVAAAAVLLGEVPRLPQSLALAAIIAGIVLLTVDRRRLSTDWPHWSIALPLAAAAIRGLIQPVTKIGLSLWPSPFAAALIGYTASSLLLVFAVAARRKSAPVRLSRTGVTWFAAVGLCNGLAVLAMYAALARGTVTLVSPLVATYPLVTLAISAMLRSVSLSLRLLAGIALTVLGSTILILT
jgi:drug/metabolite transporter (DMT)-like permease